ncbi:hypothetical protein FOCC_FOCC011710, partial [Frankliniella occidentalis]
VALRLPHPAPRHRGRGGAPARQSSASTNCSNMSLKIGFLGGGKMAQALAKGFLAKGLTSGENIVASAAPQDKQCFEAFKGMGASATSDNSLVVKQSQVVFVSVKPDMVSTVLQQVKPVVGASVFTCGHAVSADDSATAEKLLGAVGIAHQVQEKLVDPVTALSGSGPAYVFLVIEALADGAVKEGMPRDLAYQLAAQTVLGAGHLVMETGQHPAKLRDDVTSPAGSTAAGLAHLEKCAVRAAVSGAVEAATKRCKEMQKK